LTRQHYDQEHFGGHREAVLKRDNWTCQGCFYRPAQEDRDWIVVHHRVPGVSKPALMISLCAACHAIVERLQAVRIWLPPAHEENPNLQMIFPMTEVVGLLQEGVGHLMREAGLALMSLVMEEEVRHLAGERHEQHPARRAHRWGKEAGYCVVDGQKVPIERTRLRTPENREQRLGSYEMFQRSGPMEHAVWDKLMRGLSTRNYGAVVKDFREAYGVEKSAVSENFIASSREKLQELMERPLGELQLCAVLIDGTPLRGRQMIVALRINVDGRKTVLGLREGATENIAVVSELLGDLAGRGLDFSVPRLYVLDGGTGHIMC
jgi:transposase-like protein